MIYISALVKSLAESFKALCEFLTKNREKQIETDVLKDKKTLKKASNTAEEIIANTDGFFVWVANLCWDIMDFRQRRQFTHFLRKHKKLKKKFEKVN